MDTKIIKIDISEKEYGKTVSGTEFVPDKEALSQAAACLAGGGLVAFPTETVYGLGADALNAEAAAKIYAAKGRHLTIR